MRHETQQVAAKRRARVLSKATGRAADLLDLSQRELALTLGLSEATTSRLVNGDFELSPGSKPWELATLLVRVFRSLDAIAGGRDSDMRAWLHSHNRAVNGTPAELMTSAEGLVRVLHYLDANRGLV